MTYAPDDPDTMVDAALAEAANLSTDPAFKAWCHDYRAGVSEALKEPVARQALSAVWSEMPDITIEEVHGLMEDDVPRDVGEHGASRWAMAGAARAALELIRTRTGPGDVDPVPVGFVTPARSVTPQSPDVARHREREAGLVAFMALHFAETAKAHRMTGRS